MTRRRALRSSGWFYRAPVDPGTVDEAQAALDEVLAAAAECRRRQLSLREADPSIDDLDHEARVLADQVRARRALLRYAQ